jgi:hypothetical protein
MYFSLISPVKDDLRTVLGDPLRSDAATTSIE